MLCLDVCLCITFVQNSQRPEECPLGALAPLGTGVTDSF